MICYFQNLFQFKLKMKRVENLNSESLRAESRRILRIANKAVKKAQEENEYVLF